MFQNRLSVSTDSDSCHSLSSITQSYLIKTDQSTITMSLWQKLQAPSNSTDPRTTSRYDPCKADATLTSTPEERKTSLASLLTISQKSDPELTAAYEQSRCPLSNSDTLINQSRRSLDKAKRPVQDQMVGSYTNSPLPVVACRRKKKRAYRHARMQRVNSKRRYC